MPPSSHKPPQFDLLTRPGCHLCDDMRRVLDETLPEMGFDYRIVLVDSDPDLAARYGEAIPVLLRDGRPVAKVRLDAERLRRIARRRRFWSS